MANIGKWSSTTLTTIMSTELNSLANGSMIVSGSTYANQTNLNLYTDIEVFLASLSPAANSYVALYIAESVDGSNYPTPSAADMRVTITHLLVNIPTGTAGATAQRLVVRNIPLPPASFFIYLDNQTGVALNAAGNTVKFLTYNTNLNG